MKVKEKIVKRLNKAFDLGITDKNPIICRMNSRHGGFSWVIALGRYDIGSTASMTECLSWKRWVLCLELGELFEYCENGVYSKTDIIESL
jgi:hypothetical protein